MLNDITQFIFFVLNSTAIRMVMYAVAFDTMFGFIRAIKQRVFNSSFGIDGAIRKISMVTSIAFLLIADHLASFNLIAFIPEQVRCYMGMQSIGLAEFFAILYLCYEAVSILKNMYLCGLPVKHVLDFVHSFLLKYTDELPEDE